MKQSKRPKQSAPRRRPGAEMYDINRTLSTYQPIRTASQQQVTPDSPTTEPSRPKSRTQKKMDAEFRRWFTKKKFFLLLFTLLLTPLLVLGVWDYKNAADATEKLFGTRNVLATLPPEQLQAEGERTNILLVGYSADDPGHAGALLTDSIMIVSIDKQAKTGFMISVPRDLYVDIPGYRSAKINEAYQAGERNGFTEVGYPENGIGLVRKIVSENFGLPIHYHVIVNYGAVRDITDALGGITVTIESKDARGIYDPNFKPEEGGPLQLANGSHTIDGQTALRLTRARGSTFGSYGFPQSDFNRTQNQQRVFAAIRNEITVSQILDPRINKPLFDAVANNIQTDIQIGEVVSVLRLLQAVPQDKLQQVNLTDVDDRNLLASYRTPSGQSALVPAAGMDDFSAIQALVTKLSQ